MNTYRIPAAELSDDLVAAWSRWQRADASLDSPFYRPEYTRAVAQHRDDVFVAVIEEEGQPAGVLPYQLADNGCVEPVGGVLTDFQGAVTRGGLSWSPSKTFAQCGVRAYRFDHVPMSQTVLSGYRWRESDSPYVDLSAGFEEFTADRARAGSRVVSDALRKMRKAEREVGPIRLEAFSDDEQVFEATLRWKREQYGRIGAIDHLRESWKRDVLREIWKTQTEHFRGMLSALYIGDQLAATHLGMLSHGVLHCWFPTYPADDTLARYSPGIAFWIKLAQQATELGIHRLDLGKGEEPYKQRLMTGAVLLAEGCVDLRPVSSVVNRGWHGLREFVKRTPLRTPVQRALRGLRSWQRG
ncbi:MAG: GNAT family N-acetyltransferase [Pirellulaceae bacterium]